jgi:hypothetical protein
MATIRTEAGPKDYGQCTEQQDDGERCPRRVTGKGLHVCWAHYQRKRRGAKTTANVRDHNMDRKLLSGPRLAAVVILKLKAQAKADKVSWFEVQNRIVQEWLGRLDAGENPWLCGEPKPSVLARRYFLTPQVRLLPGEAAKAERWVEQNGATNYWLTQHVLEDWYRYWYAREEAAKLPRADMPTWRDPHRK